MAKQDKQNKPKPVKLPDVTCEKTAQGPHRGGNKYCQAKLGTGFISVESRPGHSQKKNFDTKK